MTTSRGSSPPHGILVLLHGYLDGPAVWARLIEHMNLPTWHVVPIALKAGQPPALTSEQRLEQYATDVLTQILQTYPETSARFVVVGHSMGGQIGELVARRLGDRLAGLVLITSAPLAGYALAPPAMERFASRAGLKDRNAIGEGKRSLAVALDQEGLDILVNCTVATGCDHALTQLHAWTGGHPAGKSPSPIGQPVLCIATDDRFFTEDLIEATAARFAQGTITKVSGAGHWPQLEQPEALARTLVDFVRAQPQTTVKQP
ncbi:alpha/beta fold hydrolase [Cupriavidus basilensis]|uniref:alpha/beta fold hydrolase n=1 Tax=Cupriavidus basilensis TaxID=68895 RepID=UPI0023E7BC1E|nr:alpha/beta hydrolase [Cupriavidus basilensis]MDF3886249.1 alpha/beta hydrolase [Cupriavidus basilensis]